MDVRGIAFALATGRIGESPFSPGLVSDGRQLMWDLLSQAGCKLPVSEKTPGQPFYLATIEELLRLADDPDAAAFYSGKHSFAQGVRLGVDCELPRVPALYTAKQQWRSYDQIHEEAEMRDNYVSAKDHAPEVQVQFEKEAALGAMRELDLETAEQMLGPLSVASLGALAKKDGSYRVIHDATHGLAVNSKIRVLEQIRSPTATDVRRAIQGLPGAFFALTGDVARAHRLVKIDQQDWRFLACRTGVKPNTVWINMVGTFGVASAAYHWSRLMSGLGRAAYYLHGKLALSQLVYVDDLLWIAGEKGALEHVVLIIFFYTLLGLPFSWKKFRGGLVCSWVGFEVSLAERSLGLTAARAEWLCNWLEQASCAGQVKIADLRAVLGRQSFACTALCNYRAFLGPLYAWVAAMANFDHRPLPKLAVLIMKFLSRAMKNLGRRQPVGQWQEHVQEVFRTDARAEGEEVWIGVWALDHTDLRHCRWFAERLDRKTAPWVFAAGESYRAISSLELLSTLVALVLFGTPPGTKLGTSCSAGTDNLGNSHVVTRCMTTRFPLSAFNMELAAQLQNRGSELHLHWLPRLQNEQADQLTNGDFTGFAMERRLRFRLDDFRGLVLAEVLAAGTQLYDEIREAKGQRMERLVKKVRRDEALRKALPSACPEDRWFLSALLVMVWASLRWSDLQRLDLSSVTATQEALMGWCWRTKSSKTGMPFGFLRCGFLDLDWGRGVLCGLAEIHARHALQDFFLQQNNKPMRYTAALSQFRRCLVCFGGMPESAVAGFSLHSLKATLLSWAGDLGVDAHDREAQGHHRSKGVSGCVAKYSRNDIAPQLRCQRAVLRAVQCGWIPGAPLDRGVLSMQSGVGSGADSTTDESGESDEEGELREVCSESGSDSDRPVGCSDEEESDLDLDLDDTGHAAATYAGPWLVNYISGVAHKAVNGGLCMACRPAAQLHNSYEKWDSNPLLMGFRACLHSGCRAAHAP